MKKIIVLIFLGIPFAPKVNADYPPNPNNCCLYYPYEKYDLCFWNDDDFLYMSVNPQEDFSDLCILYIDVVQNDLFYYLPYFLWDELNNPICGEIRYVSTYVEFRFAWTSMDEHSPFDPIRPLKVVIEKYEDRNTRMYYEYNGECTVSATNTTTVSIPSISMPCSVVNIYGKHSTETVLLHSIRDNILSKSHEGRELIRLYYLWSPVIVGAMEDDEEFREDIKGIIDGIMPMIEGK